MPVHNRISAAEADAAHAAAQIVVETHRRLAGFLRAGQTLVEIDRFIARQLEDQKARSCFLGYKPRRSGLPPFPSQACLSVNDCVVHGTAVSLERPLREGDLLKVDVGVKYHGWIGDAAWTYAFGRPTPVAARLMQAGKESLREGVTQLRPGNRYIDWARTVQSIVEGKFGFKLIRSMGGHGLVDDNKPWLHGPPYIANVLPDEDTTWEEATWPCEPGTLVAVEPMIAVGTGALKDKSRSSGIDKWPEYVADGSLSVHYEHDVLITEKGPRVLTEGMEELPDVVG